MKIRLLQMALLLLTFSFIEANQILSIETKQIKELLKTNTLYLITLNEKSKWHKNKVKVKRFHSIGKGFLEFKNSNLDLNKYNKNTLFIVCSKQDSSSLEFVKKLRNNGFKNGKYLKHGNISSNKILIDFRGIKLFSMFSK